MRQAKDRTPLLVIGCGTAFVLATVTGAVLATRWLVGRTVVTAPEAAPSGGAGSPPPDAPEESPPAETTSEAPRSGTEDIPQASASAVSAHPAPASRPPAAAAAGTPREIRRPIEGNLRSAEIGALLPAAQALAEELRPGARLVGILGYRLFRGVADLRPNNIMDGVKIVYSFEYDEAGTAPDGEDRSGSVQVTAEDGLWTALRRPGPAWLLRSASFQAGPLEAPKCPGARVFEASKLPEQAVTMRYSNERAHHPRSPAVWKLELPGGLMVIDDATCALLPDWK